MSLRLVIRDDLEGTPGTIPAGEVHAWTISLDAPAADPIEYFECLQPDERTRAERYRVERARRQFVVTRGILRRLLGRMLGAAPVDVPISYTGAGKPVLEGETPPVHFNVTHTDGLALIAIAPGPVGIDVERLRAVSDAEGLVNRFFSPVERESFRALPEKRRVEGFFRGWTSKEALIKGSALSVAYLDEFDVELDPGRPAALLAARHRVLAASAWGLLAWQPAPGYTAAVAVAGVQLIEMEASGGNE